MSESRGKILIGVGLVLISTTMFVSGLKAQEDKVMEGILSTKDNVMDQAMNALMPGNQMVTNAVMNAVVNAVVPVAETLTSELMPAVTMQAESVQAEVMQAESAQAQAPVVAEAVQTETPVVAQVVPAPVEEVVQEEPAPKSKEFSIFSPAFKEGGMIPAKYTCDGENLSPPLKIDNLPSDTGAMALIIADLDAPDGEYAQWVVYNMPATSDISEASVPGIQGRNSSGSMTYVGPCPSSGQHRYVFRIYAVKDKLKFNKKPLKADVEATAAEQLIKSAEFIAVYKKK